MTALAPHESLPMDAVSHEPAPRIAAPGLERKVREMQEDGCTVSMATWEAARR